MEEEQKLVEQFGNLSIHCQQFEKDCEKYFTYIEVLQAEQSLHVPKNQQNDENY
jgi:hypothetical protein